MSARRTFARKLTTGFLAELFGLDEPVGAFVHTGFVLHSLQIFRH
jgi:hypothetical protein